MIPPNVNFVQDVIDGLAGEERAGLLFVDAHGHRRDYTFKEISEQSQRYAAAMRALGVEQGERVALCNSNTAKCAFIVLALARLGAVAVPCPEDLDDEQICERVRKSSATTVITNRKRRPLLELVKTRLPESTRYLLVSETHEGWERLDTLAETARPFAGTATQSSDIAFIFDRDVVDYEALDEARADAEKTLEASQDDCVWSTFTFGTERWLTFVQAPWWSGAATVVHEGDFDPRERMDLVRELDVTILCQAPDEYLAELELVNARSLRLPRLRRSITAPALVGTTAAQSPQKP